MHIDNYEGGWEQNHRLPLAEALQAGVPECKFYVYKISIPSPGGAVYIYGYCICPDTVEAISTDTLSTN
tara:strand:+ start:528 stop:734 length:207 start_codon:yes stop_codon:yes gene_type:complete